MAIEFGRVIPILRMFDIAKTHGFYLDYLGFAIGFEHRFHDDAPLYMSVSRAGIELHLSEHHGDGSPGVHIRVETTGLDAFHAELQAKNYKYMNPGIVTQPWGERSMTVYDPAGNHITFCEPIEG